MNWWLIILANWINVFDLSFSATQYCFPGTDLCFWTPDGDPEVSWDNARSACQSEGGDLAVMETEEVFNFVKDSITLAGTAWIGLQDDAGVSNWRWLNNAPLYYNKWGAEEPKHSEKRGQLEATFVFDAVQSTSSIPRRVLCSTIAPNCTAPKDGCTDFSTDYIGKVTGPHGPLDFLAAKSHCESLGQKLMTIDSQEEADYLKDVLNPTDNSMLLGLTDSEVETVFRTPEGFTSPWANWYSGKPNEAENPDAVEDCVLMVKSENWKWNDVECSLSRRFYCEAPRMYIDNKELVTEELIDNNTETCLQLSGYHGCAEQQIVVESPRAGEEIRVTMTTGNVSCAQSVVMWKMAALGKYKLCMMTSVEEDVTSKYTCNFICDVTDAATMENKILLPIQASICDIKVT